MAIHPTAIIEDGARFGNNVEIGAYSYIGASVSIGDNCRIAHHVSIIGKTRIGADTEISSFSSLGAKPVIYNAQDNGALIIGARNHIAEHVTLCPGQYSDNMMTVIGDDNLFLPQTHIGHDCIIGNHTVFSTGVVVAGHVEVSDYAIISGLSAIHQFCRIGEHAFIGGGSILVEDVIPYGIVEGNRASLRGLNITGLKRRDFSKDTIMALRKVYKFIFEPRTDDGQNFQLRIQSAANMFPDDEHIKRLISFLQKEGRGFCIQKKK